MVDRFISVILSVAVILGLLLVPVTPAANVALAQPYGIGVKVTPLDTPVGPGENFSVYLWVVDDVAQSYDTVGIRLVYDTTCITATGVTPNPAFPQPILNDFNNAWSPPMGLIRSDNIFFPPGPTNDMWACRVDFTATGSTGVSPLDFIYIPADVCTGIYRAGYSVLDWSMVANGSVTVNSGAQVCADINENVTSEQRGGDVSIDGNIQGPAYPDCYVVGDIDHTFDVEAFPDTGYMFVNWTGNVANPTGNPTTVSVTDGATENITANFYAMCPMVGVSTTLIDFGGVFVGGTNPATETVTVTNICGGSLNWTSVLSYDPGNPDPTWTGASRSPTSGGPIATGQSEDVDVDVDVAGLGMGDIGTYRAYINFRPGGMNVTLQFTLLPPVGTIYVPDDYSTIQQAVNNAAGGDTIIVRDGTYIENVNIGVASLTIQSENGSANCVVNAANSKGHVFEVTVDWVNITGFTVKNATYFCKGGIYLAAAKHCNISNNTALNNHRGIWLSHSSNNNIINNAAWNNSVGILLAKASNNNTLTNSVAYRNALINPFYSNNNHGIWLSHSCNNTLTNNTMFGNNRNLGVIGSSFPHFIQNIDTSNTVNDKPVQYLVNKKDLIINSSWEVGYLGIVNSTNITVKDLILPDNGQGVLFAYTNSSRIENVTAFNTFESIRLRSSSNNNVTSNTASDNAGYGIHLSHSSNNNTLTNNTAFLNAYYGIYLESSSNNTLTSNTVYNNHRCGINLKSSSNNLIYNNYFNDTGNVRDDGNNIWNITKTAGTNIVGGPYLGGNYWLDYTGIDTDVDGLGDTLLPYGFGDYLPLVPSPNAALRGQLSFPGIQTGRVMTVSFFDPGTHAEVMSRSATTDADGNFAITDLDSGTYDISVKNDTCLGEVELGIVLVAGTTTYDDIGSSREGDVDGDDGVSIADISILLGTYGKGTGELGWNANCDFNRDSGVNIADISILLGNYGDSGDPYP